jgi:C4-dicarboxylate-specific signal transduction histidine kinase
MPCTFLRTVTLFGRKRGNSRSRLGWVAGASWLEGPSQNLRASQNVSSKSTVGRELIGITASLAVVLLSILSRHNEQVMDRIEAVRVVLGSAAVAVAACLFTFWLRRHRARSRIRDLFEDYFAERFAVEELGRRVRATVGRRFTGGSEFFIEAVAAFQHAVNARLPPTHTAQDEAKLLRQFAALKTEFGLTDRYRIEGWRPGRE